MVSTPTPSYIISKTSNNQRLLSVGYNHQMSKRFCSDDVLCVSFTWHMVKTCMIRLRVIEGPNAHDQIMSCAFHSFIHYMYLQFSGWKKYTWFSHRHEIAKDWETDMYSLICTEICCCTLYISLHRGCNLTLVSTVCEAAQISLFRAPMDW